MLSTLHKAELCVRLKGLVAGIRNDTVHKDKGHKVQRWWNWWLIDCDALCQCSVGVLVLRWGIPWTPHEEVWPRQIHACVHRTLMMVMMNRWCYCVWLCVLYIYTRWVTGELLETFYSLLLDVSRNSEKFACQIFRCPVCSCQSDTPLQLFL